MRHDTINYLVVGVFVLVLFGAFMFLLYKITGRSGPTDSYYVEYGNVEGIQYGTPVLYEGYQIGQVSRIEPERQAGGIRFRLTLDVTRGWRIAEGSVAQVIRSGLLSAVAIDIKEGRGTTPLEPGSLLAGEGASDIFSTVNDIAVDFHDLSRNSIRPLLTNLNAQIDLVAGDIHNLAEHSVRPILDDQIVPLLAKLDTSLDNLKNILSTDNQERITRTISNAEAVSGGFRELVARLEETRGLLTALLRRMDKVIEANAGDIRTSVEDLRTSLDVISRHVDALSYHLEGTSRNMHEFSRQIRENPGLLLRAVPQPAAGDQ